MYICISATVPCTGRRMGSTETSTVTTGTTVLDTFYGIPIEYSLEYSWEPRISTVPNRAPITMFLMIFDEIRDFTVPVTYLPPPWVPLPWIARFCRFFTYFTCICIYTYIHTYIYIYFIHKHIYIYIYTYIYTFIYMYMHMYIHIYII